MRTIKARVNAPPTADDRARYGPSGKPSNPDEAGKGVVNLPERGVSGEEELNGALVDETI